MTKKISAAEALNAVLKIGEINIIVAAPLGYGATSVQVAIFNALKEAGVVVHMKQARHLVAAYRGKPVATLLPVRLVRFP